MKSLSLTAKLSRTHIAPGWGQTLYLLVDVKAAVKEAHGDRLPMNLGFVIDRSGSMGGEKLDYTKQAVQFAIGHFTPRDTASLTVFDDEVQVLYPAQKVEFKETFKGEVSRIFPGGTTNLSGGLMQGYREVMKNKQDEQVNRVLLLTDGLANVGISSPDAICAKVRGMKKSGVAVTTLGVGDDFDEDLLTAMAEQSGGNYYFIDSTEHIPEIFAQELQSLLTVAAQNVRLTFQSSDGVHVSKVWNYPPIGDRTLEISLPDLFSSDRKVVVMELQITAAGIGPVALGTLSLSYEDAGASLEHTTLGVDLKVEATKDPELLDRPEEAEVMVQVEFNRTAEVREDAMRLADAGDLDGASRIMRERQDLMEEFMTSAPLDAQAEMAAEIASVAEAATTFLDQTYDARARKEMSFRNYQRRSNRNNPKP